MKIAVLIARILFGGMFIFSSIAYFAHMNPGEMPKITPEGLKFNEGLMASGYVMPVVKVVELLSGLAIISGFFLPVATVIIFPITINIFLFHVLHAPAGTPMVVGLLALNLFLAWACRKNYAGLLQLKRIP